MLIIGKPQDKDMDNYIIVDNEMSSNIQKNGFMPKYFDGDNYYFVKDEELLKFIERSDKN